MPAPAQDAVEYETRVFHEGFGKDKSIYQQPPSPEVDKAWDELYNCESDGLTFKVRANAQSFRNSSCDQDTQEHCIESCQ